MNDAFQTASRRAPEALSYALVTPARNEAVFIEGTLQSVVAQTHLPLRWVIVSDGSTDGTDEIVKRYMSENPWLELLRMPEHRDRHFAAKVKAFKMGYERIRPLQPELVGNLDADITFDADYFAFLLERFADNPRLGVAGTPFVENERTYDYRYASLEHVSGACQLFRRNCFEEIGGYQPIRGGAIDWLAVTTARMMGWQTRTFVEKHSIHHRPIGTGTGSSLAAQFKQGQKDYYVGGHPLWEFMRCVYQMKRPPWVAGGVLLGAGYAWGCLRRMKAPIPAEVKAFHRAEQMARLRGIVSHRPRTATPASEPA